MRLTPKGWQEFQHYKDRSPPWIKLHRGLLSDRKYMRLPTASKALAPLLWLLASESKSENGEFDASTEELEFRLHMSVKDIETGRKALIDKGFFIDASGVLASCQQVATPETEGEREERQRKEREEEERKLRAGTFEQFYSAYPRKDSQKTAKQAFDKAAIEDLSIVLADIEAKKRSVKWRESDGKFIPMAATYLNQRRWEDSTDEQLAPVITETAYQQSQRLKYEQIAPAIAARGPNNPNTFFDAIEVKPLEITNA